MIIKKKVQRKYFEKILNGTKKWEFRVNDFEISEDDTLTLIELENDSRQPTGREISKKVTDVTKFNPLDFYSVQEIKDNGVQIISFD